MPLVSDLHCPAVLWQYYSCGRHLRRRTLHVKLWWSFLSGLGALGGSGEKKKIIWKCIARRVFLCPIYIKCKVQLNYQLLFSHVNSKFLHVINSEAGCFIHAILCATCMFNVAVTLTWRGRLKLSFEDYCWNFLPCGYRINLQLRRAESRLAAQEHCVCCALPKSLTAFFLPVHVGLSHFLCIYLEIFSRLMLSFCLPLLIKRSLVWMLMLCLWCIIAQVDFHKTCFIFH